VQRDTVASIFIIVHQSLYENFRKVRMHLHARIMSTVARTSNKFHATVVDAKRRSTCQLSDGPKASQQQHGHLVG
jgi:hypothetical protein